MQLVKPRIETGAILLKPQHAAEMLGISKSTLARWRQQGIGPTYIRYETGRILYDPEDIELFIRKQYNYLCIVA